MPTTTRNSSWLTLAGLSLLVILGGFLRLHNLDAKSVTHVEMYVPGIRLPHGISMPEERLTLLKVVTSTLNSDTHPPAYYMMMWAWTKSFGTSAWSMRLPSALLGTACIPLVFWLGKLTRQTAAGWIAAALMAVNGHQVFWSQIARMFTLACCLGLLATILLLQIAKQSHASRSQQVLYVAVLLVGLCTHVFFWLILAAHMLWTLVNAWSQKQPLPCAARLQFLALDSRQPVARFLCLPGRKHACDSQQQHDRLCSRVRAVCVCLPSAGLLVRRVPRSGKDSHHRRPSSLDFGAGCSSCCPSFCLPLG